MRYVTKRTSGVECGAMVGPNHTLTSLNLNPVTLVGCAKVNYESRGRNQPGQDLTGAAGRATECCAVLLLCFFVHNSPKLTGRANEKGVPGDNWRRIDGLLELIPPKDLKRISGPDYGDRSTIGGQVD